MGWLLLMGTLLCGYGAPVVANVRAEQRVGKCLVDIVYDVAAAGVVTISAAVSTNNGIAYDLPAVSFSGDYGAGVTPGTNKSIVWDSGADWSGQYSSSMRVKVIAADGSEPPLPPDPASKATQPENGVVTLIGNSTAFLYTGANPIQTGVAYGTIAAVQAAVFRGRVLDNAGQPLSGVAIAVQGHPEFGQTLTRTNGQYDLAVNGGDVLNLNYDKSGYLAVQRTFSVPWREFVVAEDVVMLTEDDAVSFVALPSTNWQTAAGSVMSDQDGTRRAVVFFPPQTRASIITHAGVTQETATLTTRFTEYTVGANGPQAMPGDLPPTVAYTYALALGADEAQTKVAGKDVLFNTNVYLYVDNFLGFPTGARAPMGYYDNDLGAWVPSSDGRVIRLLGVTDAGLARISVTANLAEAGAAALTALGFTDGERRKLVEMYPAATNSLWRVPITHFSNRDINYPLYPANTDSPNISLGSMNATAADNAGNVGGMGSVEWENQVFREALPVAGTPFGLHWTSAGRKARLVVPLIGDAVPRDLERVELQIEIAGRTYESSHVPCSNLKTNFIWDGRDAYGRQLQGAQVVALAIRYIYPAYYAIPAAMAASFGLTPDPDDPDGFPLLRSTYRSSAQRLYAALSHTPPRTSIGLGGWSLSAHHIYDPTSKTIYFGDGETRQGENNPYDLTIASVAGVGTAGFSGDGGAATNAVLHYPAGIAIAADGAFYFSDWWNHRVRRVDTNGVITTVAGTGTGGFSGDGGAATNAGLSHPQGLAFGPNGALYIADSSNNRVRRVNTNGIIQTVAGTGTGAHSGDGGPATSAGFVDIVGVDVASDGTLYIADMGANRIRRVGPDGVISTIAGTGAGGFSGDGGAATNAMLSSPYDVDVAPDGSLLVTDGANNRIRRVAVNGIISTVAGDNSVGTFYGDGGPATNAALNEPFNLTVCADGSFYICDSFNYRIRYVDSAGIIRTVVGTGSGGYSGDNGPAAAAKIQRYCYLAVDPDHHLYAADYFNNRVRRMGAMQPGVGCSDIQIAAPDGQIVYHFSANGRHLRTCSALTGSNLFVFAYTSAGYLKSITDGDGNITAIERDEASQPTAIRGPFGQRTALTVNTNGWLSAVRNPLLETVQLAYTADGLLNSVIGAKGSTYNYTVTYGDDGRVQRTDDPANGITRYGRAEFTNSYQVSITSALNRVMLATATTATNGSSRRSQFLADGSFSATQTDADGSETCSSADGAAVSVKYGPDPRFGMQAPIATTTVMRLPSGLSMTTIVQQAAAMDGNVLMALTNITTVNSRATTGVYTRADSTIRSTTPAGRQTLTRIDAQGRALVVVRPGILPVTNTYDACGRISMACIGARVTHYTYDTNGFLAAITDPLGRTNRMQCDDAGQVINHIRPDGSAIQYAYDAHGNRTSVAPPGRSAHAFGYSLVDLVTNYTAPGGAPLITSYNADRQPTQLDRGGGQILTFGYDAGGRAGTNDLAGNYVVYAYLTNGQVGSIATTGGVIITRQYDGNLITNLTIAGVITGMVAYTYNNDFQPASQAINGGPAISFAYDADKLLTNAGLCRIARASASGMVTNSVVSNITESIGYSAYGELSDYTAFTNGAAAFSLIGARDLLGRITNIHETLDGVAIAKTYQYDLAGQLVVAITNGVGSGASTYAYDANGNRTNWLVDGVAGWAVYDEQDRLLQFVNGNITNTYQYNAAGNLTNKTAGADVTGYTYDGAGSLMAVSLPDGRAIAYRVDGYGRRVAKYVDGVFNRGFIYGNGLLPIAELDAQSNVVSQFVYADGNGAPLYMIRTGAVYRVITDQLGSPRLMLEASTGEIAQRLDYDEWGRITSDSAPGFQPFGFAGGLYDADTGLIRFGARDYDPEAGRWTARDPVLFDGGSPNLYAYCANNPVNLLDAGGTGPGGNLQSANILFDIYSMFSVVPNNAIANSTLPNWAIQINSGFSIVMGVVGLGINGAIGYQQWQNPSTPMYEHVEVGMDIMIGILGVAGGPGGAALALGFTAVDYGTEIWFTFMFNQQAKARTRPETIFSQQALQRLKANRNNFTGKHYLSPPRR